MLTQEVKDTIAKFIENFIFEDKDVKYEYDIDDIDTNVILYESSPIAPSSWPLSAPHSGNLLPSQSSTGVPLFLSGGPANGSTIAPAGAGMILYCAGQRRLGPKRRSPALRSWMRTP